MPCSAWLTTQHAVHVPSLQVKVSWVTGTTPMELEFPTVLKGGISTETEVLVWYVWTGGEEEQMEFTAVRYLMQQVLTRPYTLEYTQ